MVRMLVLILVRGWWQVGILRRKAVFEEGLDEDVLVVEEEHGCGWRAAWCCGTRVFFCLFSGSEKIR